jgi:hypothetical protein
MAIPLDSKEIVTVQELAVSNMLEIGAMRELLFGKGIISEEEFVTKFRKLDRETKEKGGLTKKVSFKLANFQSLGAESF